MGSLAWIVCFLSQIAYLYQIQIDLGRENSVLCAEIIHTLVLIRGGDHRSYTNAVERFVKHKICFAGVFYFYEEALCAVLNMNIDTFILDFQP